MYLKKQLFKKDMFMDISMNERPISIIFPLKAGALCWEADVNGAKLRNVAQSTST